MVGSLFYVNWYVSRMEKRAWEIRVLSISELNDYKSRHNEVHMTFCWANIQPHLRPKIYCKHSSHICKCGKRTHGQLITKEILCVFSDTNSVNSSLAMIYVYNFIGNLSSLFNIHTYVCIINSINVCAHL